MANLPHYADTRRARGRYYRYPESQRGQVEQFPVICAADVIDQEVTMCSRPEMVVTSDPAAVRCPDCRERLGR